MTSMTIYDLLLKIVQVKQDNSDFSPFQKSAGDVYYSIIIDSKRKNKWLIEILEDFENNTSITTEISITTNTPSIVLESINMFYFDREGNARAMWEQEGVQKMAHAKQGLMTVLKDMTEYLEKQQTDFGKVENILLQRIGGNHERN